MKQILKQQVATAASSGKIKLWLNRKRALWLAGWLAMEKAKLQLHNGAVAVAIHDVQTHLMLDSYI